MMLSLCKRKGNELSFYEAVNRKQSHKLFYTIAQELEFLLEILLHLVLCIIISLIIFSTLNNVKRL